MASWLLNPSGHGIHNFLVSFFDLNQTHCSLAQIIINDPNWERKVMQMTVRYSAIGEIIPGAHRRESSLYNGIVELAVFERAGTI